MNHIPTTTPPAAESALPVTPFQFGVVFAGRMFAGRKGHGGGPCLKRNLRENEIAELLETAYRAGIAEGSRLARNAHAAAQQRIALLEWAIDSRANVVRLTGTDEWELYFPSNGLPTAQGISRDDVIIKAHAARLALRHPST